MASAADRDPRHHTQKMQKALMEIQEHLREDIEKVDDPQLKAMFETSAEVLGGLRKAFQDYEQKNEAGWRREGSLGVRMAAGLQLLTCPFRRCWWRPTETSLRLGGISPGNISARKN